MAGDTGVSYCTLRSAEAAYTFTPPASNAGRPALAGGSSVKEYSAFTPSERNTQCFIADAAATNTAGGSVTTSSGTSEGAGSASSDEPPQMVSTTRSAAFPMPMTRSPMGVSVDGGAASSTGSSIAGASASARFALTADFET